jgi:hypothetical protein
MITPQYRLIAGGGKAIEENAVEFRAREHCPERDATEGEPDTDELEAFKG